MTARHKYRNDAGDLELVPTVLRWVYTGQARAEEGQAGTWTVYVDDPDLTLDFVGHRRWIVYEDESDDANEIILDGLTQNVRISHSGGDVTNPTGRVIAVDIADLNTLWQYRVMIGSDSQRPEETDIERMTALANSEEMGYFDDLTFVSAGSPVDMEEENVRGQYTGQVADACAQDSGKNWYISSTGTVGEIGADIFLWYGKDSLNTYTSPLTLSNDPADLDMQAVNAGTATVYPLGADTELRRDYARQYSGAYGTFQGGAKYIGDEDNPYAPVITTSGRDIVHPAPEIRSRDRMKRRLLRVLRDHAGPDEVISTTITLPARKVSQLRQGMRVSTKGTHLTGYESPSYLRVLSAAPQPIGRKAGGDMYAVAVELQGPGNPATALACSTSSIEATTTSNNTSAAGSSGATENVSLVIDPGSSDPHVVLAALGISSAGPPFATSADAGAGYTTLSTGTVTSLTPVGAVIYKAGVTATETVLADYAAGYNGTDKWAMVAVAFASAATAPVQSVNQQRNSSGPWTATLPSVCTSGNLIILAALVRRNFTTFAAGSVDPPGFTLLGTAYNVDSWSVSPGTTYDISIYAKCSDGTEQTITMPLLGREVRMMVSEWEIL